MSPEQATALRKPFPPESIGQLPKGGVMLDYVGHAAITDRLLMVDPEWTWEPFALTPEGLPALDRAGNLWIRLTVCGVTRIGVGDGKNAKEVIGDALRNAGMRFGLALDLWAKENLVEFRDAVAAHHKQPAGGDVASEGEASVRPPAAGAVSPGGPAAPGVEPAGGGEPTPSPPAGAKKAGAAQKRMIFATLSELGVDPEDRFTRLLVASHFAGRPIGTFDDLTPGDASRVIDGLAAVPDMAAMSNLLATIPQDVELPV